MENLKTLYYIVVMVLTESLMFAVENYFDFESRSRSTNAINLKAIWLKNIKFKFHYNWFTSSGYEVENV